MKLHVKFKARNAPCSGFTLIELVFIVFLVGVIASFAYPHLDSAIDEGRYIECEGQLEAIRRAKSLYVVDHLGKEFDLSPIEEEIEVFNSYFVTPLPSPPHCPRVGLDAAGLPVAPYENPYNLYAIATCPFCATNIPGGVRPYTPVP